MSEILHVTSARPVRDFVLWLRFSDGSEGEVDLGEELEGEIFEALRAPEVFAQVRLHPELRTVTWPNGADFAPEFLHALLPAAA
jgi:hypothetical protein